MLSSYQIDYYKGSARVACSCFSFGLHNCEVCQVHNKRNVGWVYVHVSAFVENPETYKSGKTARNGLSFCLKTYSMNKISKAGHSLYKSPHEWPLSDSNSCAQDPSSQDTVYHRPVHTNGPWAIVTTVGP